MLSIPSQERATERSGVRGRVHVHGLRTLNANRPTRNFCRASAVESDGLSGSFPGWTCNVGRWTFSSPKDELLHSPAFYGSGDQTSLLASRSWVSISRQSRTRSFLPRKDKLSVAVYEKGPKVLLQGKGTEEFVQFEIEPKILEEAKLGYEEVHSPEMFEPHFGIDESGKGDFFGPLVIAGVYVDAIESHGNFWTPGSRTVSESDRMRGFGLWPRLFEPRREPLSATVYHWARAL